MQPLVHRLVTTALLVSAATAVAPALAPVAALAATPPAAAAMARPRPRLPRPAARFPARRCRRPCWSSPCGQRSGHRRQRAAAVLSQEFQAGPTGRANGDGTVQAVAAARRRAGQVAHRTEKIYVVKPPAGRFHESLWEIAENHLGDGRRYREIFELN